MTTTTDDVINSLIALRDEELITLPHISKTMSQGSYRDSLTILVDLAKAEQRQEYRCEETAGRALRRTVH